ncbi:SH3 domain-containing protein [Noviherbaspirillum sedimenti]|uniref:SH3b domain-containing protein n=1 Tax=Noviherbaspirillum sedimenti TaxID=2320865 RepID=A0A3A3GM72_9BURK|nr:SH3 domain-containing protein [Noviherbaspirillum sedimenti]RJG03396.1 hypothetical protein D3878_18835 [Noviherbaspirillum sedimenti]
MKIMRCMTCAAVLLAASAGAHALTFKSVGAAPAILYDAPSHKGKKVFVAPRGMPVEIVLTYGEWTKVRDVSGDLFWVESSQLQARRMLMVRVANARIRAIADDSGVPVFSADKGVLLELAEPVSGGWLKVRHRDGQGGFIKSSEVWGE